MYYHLENASILSEEVAVGAEKSSLNAYVWNPFQSVEVGRETRESQAIQERYLQAIEEAPEAPVELRLL